MIFGALTSNLWLTRKIGPKSSSSVSHWVLMDILAMHCGCCMCLADVCTAFATPHWFSHLMAFTLWHHLFCHHSLSRVRSYCSFWLFFLTTTAATVTNVLVTMSKGLYHRFPQPLKRAICSFLVFPFWTRHISLTSLGQQAHHHSPVEVCVHCRGKACMVRKAQSNTFPGITRFYYKKSQIIKVNTQQYSSINNDQSVTISAPRQPDFPLH